MGGTIDHIQFESIYSRYYARFVIIARRYVRDSSAAEDLVMESFASLWERRDVIAPGTIWECYSPSEPAPSVHHGRRVRPDFCGWSALGPISLFIENVLGFHDIDALSRTVRWDMRHSCRHGLENLSFGDTKTSLVYDPASSEVKVRSDRPYTLILNGKKHKIKDGTTTIPFPQN